MATTFGTCYSGIGGADIGLLATGWQLRFQAEADPFRREILARRFSVPLECDVALTRPSEPYDALYAELPDSRIEKWWAPLNALVRDTPPTRWLIVELSPTVRCERVIRDVLALGEQWAFRLIHLDVTIQLSNTQIEDWDVKKRALILASPDAAAIDAIGLAAMSAEIVVTGVSTLHQRLSLAWHEVSRGLRAGWTCVCGSPESCACAFEQRLSAVQDATSPFMTQWLGEILNGTWRDGVARKLTAADGSPLGGALDPCMAAHETVPHG